MFAKRTIVKEENAVVVQAVPNRNVFSDTGSVEKDWGADSPQVIRIRE
jgi:hypothetical protein